MSGENWFSLTTANGLDVTVNLARCTLVEYGCNGTATIYAHLTTKDKVIIAVKKSDVQRLKEALGVSLK